MDRLVLWDIDGTLVAAGGLGAEVFDRALEQALGARPPERVRMSGKTDPQIVGEYLTMLAVADHEVHLPLVLDALERELAAAEEELRTHGRALPGARELLEALDERGDVLQSVLTGNIAPNALVKLASFGLDRYVDLEIGAFGSDHADRTRLVGVALGRAERLRGRRFSPEQVWIVGDSPNDLACARAGGGRCVLVATGRFAFDELAPLGAEVVLPDLTDTAALVEILTS